MPRAAYVVKSQKEYYARNKDKIMAHNKAVRQQKLQAQFDLQADIVKLINHILLIASS